MSGTEQRRTQEEQEILDIVAERTGEEYAEEHAALALAQARRIGIIGTETNPSSKS